MLESAIVRIDGNAEFTNEVEDRDVTHIEAAFVLRILRRIHDAVWASSGSVDR